MPASFHLQDICIQTVLVFSWTLSSFSLHSVSCVPGCHTQQNISTSMPNTWQVLHFLQLLCRHIGVAWPLCPADSSSSLVETFLGRLRLVLTSVHLKRRCIFFFSPLKLNRICNLLRAAAAFWNNRAYYQLPQCNVIKLDMCICFWPPREGKASGQAVCLRTLKGDFTLSGSGAEDMSELVTMFLSGLTERSQYAVALREVERQGLRTARHTDLSLLLLLMAKWLISCIPLQMTPHSSASRKESSFCSSKTASFLSNMAG